MGVGLYVMYLEKTHVIYVMSGKERMTLSHVMRRKTAFLPSFFCSTSANVVEVMFSWIPNGASKKIILNAVTFFSLFLDSYETETCHCMDRYSF